MENVIFVVQSVDSFVYFSVIQVALNLTLDGVTFFVNCTDYRSFLTALPQFELQKQKQNHLVIPLIPTRVTVKDF